MTKEDRGGGTRLRGETVRETVGKAAQEKMVSL